MDAYGAMKDDNLVISAVAGSESTSYTYACVSVERLSAWCVCLSESHFILLLRSNYFQRSGYSDVMN